MEDNIYEIIYMVRMGDPSALNILMDSFHETIACHVRRFCKDRPYEQFEQDDLIQEGMFGLIQAIREYRADKAASFKTFAETCIRNRLYSALRAASRDKHFPLNQSISLDTPFFDSNSYTSGAFLMNLTDPELLIIDRDHVSSLLESTRKQLSEFEAKILGYYLDGLSVKEIAETMGRSPKSVDNAVQRVRRKAARHITSGDISKR